MKRKAKTKRKTARGGTLLVICAVALFVLLLLLRMIAYVAHARHHF